MALLSPPPIRPPNNNNNNNNIITNNSNNNNVIISTNPSSSPMMRMPSSKLPKGRHLTGEKTAYDIDVRMEGEMQPQLEVTPITKYMSDPGPILGRQIAVNKTYICYGLKMGAIRVLNINTALRALLKGLAQRVTDMAFFAEDVHLLASASVDGRIYVWKLTEGLDEENKSQIKEKIVISIQIVGEGESVHPRVCWHCHKQEVLVIGIGRSVLRIDTTKVGKANVNSTDEPLRFAIDNLIDGVQLVGKHEDEVTDLSMCQWMTTRLVSASTDGTIKIWEDRKAQPLLVLRPHDGQPVNSVTFLTAPHRPDHIILITGGPRNREVKIWVSGSEEGWLLPSDAESWHCTQTLDFKSSASRLEESFFNQVVALPQAGLLLLANAKKNAIYAVHLDYGVNPTATRMDYVAEFTVTMPILSFTGTSDLLPNGELVQVYCVQTQAIQQYALDLSQCLPPPLENMLLEKSDPIMSRDAFDSEGFANLEQPGFKPVEISLTSSAPKQSVPDTASESATMTRRPPSSTSLDTVISADSTSLSSEPKPISLSAITGSNDISCVASSPLSLSPRLSGKLSGFRSPINGSDPALVIDDRGGDKQVIEFSVDRQMDNMCMPDVPPVEDDSRSNESKVVRDDISTVLNHPAKFKHPTHLVTPSEILMATSSSETSNVIEQMSEGEAKIHDVPVNSDEQNVEVDVKVVGESRFSQSKEIDSHGELNNLDLKNKDKVFCSQASDLGMEMARECSALSSETYLVQESRPIDRINVNEFPTQSLNTDEQGHDTTQDTSERTEGLDMSAAVAQQVTLTTKGKKQKGKNALGLGPSSPSPSVFNSAELNSDLADTSRVPSTEQNLPDNMAIMDMLIQMEASRKEDQKQMMAVTKEIRRVEAAMCRMVEKSSKANFDALWARNQEEFAKQDKVARERQQHLISSIANGSSKELPVLIEKIIKKELAVVGQVVARAVTPVIEKTVSAAIADSFQRGVGDKAVNQLEKSVTSKLEASISRQIMSQFQTSGKQAIQEAMKNSMEATVVPAFDRSCQAMFEQVDATFQKGMIEHSTASQQQYESTHSPLAAALRDVINSASSVTQTLTAELADGQRKLVALAVAGANSKATNPLITQLSNGPLGVLHDKIEAPLDPTTELSRLISERKYEEAFTAALQRSDVSIVSWLCSQVDLHKILTAGPIPLSQGVLLSLLQQLACDITNDTSRKLGWMTDVAVAINPSDTLIAVHVRPIFEQVYQILNHHRSIPTASGTEPANVRLLMHFINSMLMGSK